MTLGTAQHLINRAQRVLELYAQNGSASPLPARSVLAAIRTLKPEPVEKPAQTEPAFIEYTDLPPIMTTGYTDTDRLNWLLERPCRMPIESTRGYIVQEWVGHTTGRGSTPRDAIDAAMKAQESK